jgi:transposase InsO family protein
LGLEADGLGLAAEPHAPYPKPVFIGRRSSSPYFGSDQGCTYASEDYQTILEGRGITCSMSRRGDCYDNAVAEAFFSTVKSELADRFGSYSEAKMELFDYLEVYYNQRR